MLLLDQGLPRSAVEFLEELGIHAQHVGALNLSTASDREILDYALAHGMQIVTLDSDFHALLALSGASGPSVIRLRDQGLKGQGLAHLLQTILQRFHAELERGAVISASESSLRIRSLPIGAKPR